jgi:hypothetical protein
MSTVNKCTTRFFPVNHAQLSKAVKGHDPRHRIRYRRSLWRSYAILIGIILFAVFGTMLVIAIAGR